MKRETIEYRCVANLTEKHNCDGKIEHKNCRKLQSEKVSRIGSKSDGLEPFYSAK